MTLVKSKDIKFTSYVIKLFKGDVFAFDVYVPIGVTRHDVMRPNAS